MTRTNSELSYRNHVCIHSLSPIVQYIDFQKKGAFLNHFTWSPLNQDQFPVVINNICGLKNDDCGISGFRKLISSKGVPPCWLHDDVLDFLAFTLFRGNSHIGTQFSYATSGYSGMLFNEKLPGILSVSNP